MWKKEHWSRSPASNITPCVTVSKFPFLIHEKVIIAALPSPHCCILLSQQKAVVLGTWCLTPSVLSCPDHQIFTWIRVGTFPLLSTSGNQSKCDQVTDMGRDEGSASPSVLPEALGSLHVSLSQVRCVTSPNHHSHAESYHYAHFTVEETEASKAYAMGAAVYQDRADI